jgi:hypothetical protein
LLGKEKGKVGATSPAEDVAGKNATKQGGSCLLFSFFSFSPSVVIFGI